MNKLNGRIACIPLYIVVGFWGATLFLYCSNIFIQYPGGGKLIVFGYVLFCAVLLIAGYFLGLKIRFKTVDIKNTNRVAVLGFLFYLILFVPTVYSYTGNNIFSFFDLLLSPSDAYKSMVDTVTDSRDERGALILVKTLLSPFVITVIPYFSYTWFKYKENGRYLVAVIFLYFSMSVYRGTDKEGFDVLILVFSALLMANPSMFTFLSKDKKKALYFVFIFVVLLVLVYNFSYRKGERLSGVNEVCFKGTAICNAIDPEQGGAAFGAFMLSRYLTQGYHGLSIAFEADFNSGYGFGHSRPLQYLSSKVFGGVDRNMVVSQLDSLGWASKGLWSTGFVWLANDVPLLLVPFVILFFGLIMALAWKMAITRENFPAIIVFSFMFFSLIYMPGNLQLAQSGDLYVGYLFWLSFFLLGAFVPKKRNV